MNSSSKLAYEISEAAANKKATDIKLLNVSDLSTIADFFIICSGNSTTQVRAIADEIVEKVEEKGVILNHKEGYDTSRWILLDFGAVIAHVFIKEDRDFYNLERLWGDAEIINL